MKKIKLSKTSKKHSGKFEALIDDEDSDLCVYGWSAKIPRNTRVGKRIYAVRVFGGRKGKEKFIHSVISERFLGPKPSGSVVDHINGDTLDNRRFNLRYVSNRENGMKRHGLNSNNTSGHRGIDFCKIHKKWKARRCVDGKRISLGYFRSLEAAVEAMKQ